MNFKQLIVKVGGILQSVSSRFAFIAIAAYRTIGTTYLGGACRFEPSCSEYALIAYERFGFLKASVLTLKRIIKCRPGGPFGFDPVPETKAITNSKDNLSYHRSLHKECLCKI